MSNAHKITLKIKIQGVPKKLSPVCVATVEKLQIQLSRFLHSCIGQA